MSFFGPTKKRQGERGDGSNGVFHLQKRIAGGKKIPSLVLAERTVVRAESMNAASKGTKRPPTTQILSVKIPISRMRKGLRRRLEGEKSIWQPSEIQKRKGRISGTKKQSKKEKKREISKKAEQPHSRL